MEVSQRVAEVSETGAGGDGVKTKIGCEEVFWGRNLPPRGVVNNYFPENSSDLSDNFLPSSPEKSRFTLWLDAADPSRGRTAA